VVEARGGCVQPLVVGVRVSHCIGLIIHHSVIQRSFVALISWFVQTGGKTQGHPLRGFGYVLRSFLRLLFCCELLLDSKGDGIVVHPIRLAAPRRTLLPSACLLAESSMTASTISLPIAPSSDLWSKADSSWAADLPFFARIP